MALKKMAVRRYLYDSSLNLTKRERNTLEISWAKIFADETLPFIDEERFSGFYRVKASRPNAPVNESSVP